MSNKNEYDLVMRELEEVSDLLDRDKSVDSELDIDDNGDFKWEYAFESITESHSAYKRRITHI